MSNLQALQQNLLHAVLAHKSPHLRELNDDPRADTAARLAIYRYGYRVRLRDALETEFTGLAMMAGRRLASLLENYVEAHPSGHYNIRWHGAGMAAFLGYTLPWRNKPELAEMARLDWAISTAFDAADEPVIVASDLAQIPADAWVNLHLQPQSHLQILATFHNLDAFRRAADHGDKRPHLRRYNKSRHLLVWRQLLTVRYRLLEADEMSALKGAIDGESFAALCARLAEYHDPADALPRMASLLHQWLDQGLIAAWSLS